jgi:AcrR family transcriptional regulator
MPARPTARRKILDTAARLFYQEGANTTGVDRIAAEAGVSKRSLYQYFSGKDALMAAALADAGPAVLEGYLPTDDNAAPGREKILRVFDALRDRSESPDFRGCPFMNVTTQITDPTHPVRAVASDFKRNLKEYFAEQGRIGGADDPVALAEQLLMIFDGAITQALINLSGIPDSALRAAEILLEAHGLDASNSS